MRTSANRPRPNRTLTIKTETQEDSTVTGGDMRSAGVMREKYKKERLKEGQTHVENIMVFLMEKGYLEKENLNFVSLHLLLKPTVMHN